MCFLDFCGCWVVFSDSLAFSASIALFFVPKDPLGSDFKPKQNFQNTWKTSLSPGTPRGGLHESSHEASLPHPPNPRHALHESCSGAVLQQLANRHRTVDEASGSERARRARRACRLARTLPDGSSTFLRCPPSGGAWPRVLKPWGWAVGLPQLLVRA